MLVISVRSLRSASVLLRKTVRSTVPFAKILITDNYAQNRLPGFVFLIDF